MYANREKWLTESIKLLRPLFEQHGLTIPEMTIIAPGFPWGNKKAIGQCWSPKVTQNGTTQIFIAPITEHRNPISALGTVVHELIHAAVGTEAAHGKKFKVPARAMGLKGRLTATFIEEESLLQSTLQDIADALGQYPDDPLDIHAIGKKRRAREKMVVLVYKKDESITLKITPMNMRNLIKTGHFHEVLSKDYYCTINGRSVMDFDWDEAIREFTR
jgi:hypothetical protein